MRRVVVTGLGAVTPLGVGARRTWSRLLAGDCGITSVADREPKERWQELTSTVAGVVPLGGIAKGGWDAGDWLSAAEQRRMSRFTQYAIAASEMALKDAEWDIIAEADKEETGVCLGSGIGNLDDIYTTSLEHNKGVSFTWAPAHNGLTRANSPCRGIKEYHHCLCPRSSQTWQQAISP